MPATQHAASGDDSPPEHSTIKVAMPGSASSNAGPRPKRLKLTVRKPSLETEEADNNPSRPKRKSARPARYSDDVTSTKPRKNSSGSIMSVAASEKSSSPEPPVSPVEKESAGYGADFLAMYIMDDSPKSEKEREPSPVVEPQPKPKKKKEAKKDHPPSLKLKMSSSVSATPATPATPDSLPPDVEAQLPPLLDKPRTIDDPATIIKKLQNACQALSGLKIPAVYITEESLPLPKKEEVGVCNLLNAAAGDSPVEGNDWSLAYTGMHDEDMTELVRHAANLIRNYMVTKVQTAKVFGKKQSRKKDNNGRHAIESEKFAFQALQDLLWSSALNVNCITNRDRSRLIRTLYKQIELVLYYFNPQPHVQPHLIPHPQMAYLPPYQQNLAAEAVKANVHYQAQQQHGPPPPHQFLFREHQNPYNSPYNGAAPPSSGTNGPVLMDKIKMYSPGFLPRSGQSMKFSFQPTPPPPSVQTPALDLPRSGQNLRFSFQQYGPQNGAPPIINGVPIHMPMGPPPLPHGMSPSPMPPGMTPHPMYSHPGTPQPQTQGQQRRGSGSDGYPHPGAVIIDN